MKIRIWILLAGLVLSCQSRQPAGTDYAKVSQKDAWLHHPVLGDPSFDAFVRYAGNPILRGTPPLEWPVNGFYFEDPVSGNEYIYAGCYPKNYAISSKDGALDITQGCVVYCSADKGKSWQKKGAIFHDKNFIPDGEDHPASFAPDVSIVYHEKRYYIGFDYVTSGFSWSNDNLRHSGLAVGVSDSPEGPFIIFRKPAVPCSLFYDNPLFGKYNRCYAGTLLKAKGQWVMLFMLDSGSHFSWALAAVSAPSPEGPWSAPVLLKSVEDEGYYPSLLEYFPAFQYHDTIFAPATSVALNRNFQAVHCVPVADVMRPERWKLWKEGSLWHSENRENEHAGIWGQTFSGQVASDGRLKVMFPSLDTARRGTINVATGRWNSLYRDSGFVFTGQGGASISFLRNFFHRPEISAELSYWGTISILLDASPPFGPNTPKADATLHALMYTSQTRLELSDSGWLLARADSAGRVDTLGTGRFGSSKPSAVNIRHSGEETIVALEGRIAWKGKLNGPNSGRVGLLAMPHSGAEVKSFVVSGKPEKGHSSWLYSEGLLNAGCDLNDWEIRKKDTLFRHGTGALSKIENAKLKWSFKGSGFDLYAPGLPEAGTAELSLNGKKLAEINLATKTPRKSSIIWSVRNLPPQNNALVIKGINGKIIADCLIVYD